MDTELTDLAQRLADQEQRCYWIGWPPSGRPRMADNPEVLEITGCERLQRINPNRPADIAAILNS